MSPTRDVAEAMARPAPADLVLGWVRGVIRACERAAWITSRTRNGVPSVLTWRRNEFPEWKICTLSLPGSAM